MFRILVTVERSLDESVSTEDMKCIDEDFFRPKCGYEKYISNFEDLLYFATKNIKFVNRPTVLRKSKICGEKLISKYLMNFENICDFDIKYTSNFCEYLSMSFDRYIKIGDRQVRTTYQQKTIKDNFRRLKVERILS